MKEKNRSGLIIFLIIIILALTVLLFLSLTSRLELNSNEEKNDETEIVDNANESINYDELAKINKSTYNFVNGDYTNEHSVNVLSDGKVLIDFKDSISNITNAKDLILFTGPGTDSIAYIITVSGEVYKYDFNGLEATKMDEYSNIQRIVRYKTRKGNAGGCDYVVLITSDGKYYSIDSYCV